MIPRLNFTIGDAVFFFHYRLLVFAGRIFIDSAQDDC